MLDKNKIEYFFFISFARFFNFFGFRKAWLFAKLLAFFMYYFVPVRKHVVFKNLRLAFPNYSEQKLKQIAKANYFIFCKSLIEMMCIPRLTKEDIFSIVECDGVDLIKSRAAEKKGLIFLTGHFSNFELAAIYGSLALNLQMNVLVKPQRNSYVSNWLNNMRESFGNKVILLGVSVRNLFKVLNERGIVGIVGDQRGPVNSPRVKLFGIETALYTGTAALAIKTQIPVIIGFMISTGKNKYRLELEELLLKNFQGDKEQQISAFNQKYMEVLEKYVRKYPDHWFWMHNIWKY